METLDEGLFHFYSSQADLLLAQYENINQLLGKTTDWTHPGTHCEILLRDFLRRHLLNGMSVDKGFIFGRVNRNGKESHGPEIDILIHNTTEYRPVFRLEDFVIVQPDAVLAIIQVKRTFHSGKDNALAKGIQQAVAAKQHLLDLRVENATRQSRPRGADLSTIKRIPHIPELMSVFSAVVSFDDDTNKDPETYRQHLLDAYCDNRQFAYPDCQYDTGVCVLPQFVGSIKHVCLTSRASVVHQEYQAFSSVHDKKNVGLQLFLAVLTQAVFNHGAKRPPFAFPTLKPLSVVQVPRAEESLHKPPPA